MDNTALNFPYLLMGGGGGGGWKVGNLTGNSPLLDSRPFYALLKWNVTFFAFEPAILKQTRAPCEW